MAALIGGLLVFFHLFRATYPYVLGWTLNHKAVFMTVIFLVIGFGMLAWLGLGWSAEKAGLPMEKIRTTTFWANATEKFPGFGKEFMPPLDEGSFLYMPMTMVHASIGESLDVLSKQDQAITAIPEVESAVGKPYLEIRPDLAALKRYGVKIADFQDVVEVAIGGKQITTTVEGRNRFPVRVRYRRELRDRIETIGKILVPGMIDGHDVQVPLAELVKGQDVRLGFIRGPQEIKSEDTFKVGYVLFDMKPGNAEVDVVEESAAYLKSKISGNELILPPGVTYTFAGNYENQLRAQRRFAVVLPLALFAIFLLLYFQFRSVATTLLVFFGIFVAWSGGFILIWFYGQPWFLDFSVFGVDMRQLFQVHTINLSVAVWVGFLALFGIASDDGVVISTYLDQVFRSRRTTNVRELRQATIEAGKRRVRPCLMTTATTILALIPVLTSMGRGSDVMVPMAIPSFGGMVIEVLTMLTVPVLYCFVKEIKLLTGMRDELLACLSPSKRR